MGEVAPTGPRLAPSWWRHQVVVVVVAVVVAGVAVAVAVVVVGRCWPMLALFGRRFAPVLALGCCCWWWWWCGVGVGVVVVGRCWPYLGAGLPLSWP